MVILRHGDWPGLPRPPKPPVGWVCLQPFMKRALVVEDDPDIVELIAHYLRAEGFEVEAVGDGRRALERLRAGSYHLVILDLQLPGMDGLSRVRRGAPRQAHRAPCRSSC